MIKVEVVEKFTLGDYKKLKNVKKITNRKENEFGIGDTFECDDEMLKYLTGGNSKKKVVVQILEVIPEEDIVQSDSIEFHKEEREPKVKLKIEEKPKKKRTSKKKGE